MSRRSKDFPPALVVVIDTSVLIEFKRIVPVQKQWDLLLMMSDLVESGHLCFPKEVARELADAQHPDAPGVWANGCTGHARHRLPSYDALAEVLGVAPLLQDIEAEKDIADPYVAAMGDQRPAQRRERGCRDERLRGPARQGIARGRVRQARHRVLEG